MTLTSFSDHWPTQSLGPKHTRLIPALVSWLRLSHEGRRPSFHHSALTNFYFFMAKFTSSALHKVFCIYQVHGELICHRTFSILQLSMVCYTLPAPPLDRSAFKSRKVSYRMVFYTYSRWPRIGSTQQTDWFASLLLRQIILAPLILYTLFI